MESNTRDHLTTVPPEILTKILAEVPLSSFLSLTHTCSGLRQFLKANAAQICNAAIRARFPTHAEVLNSSSKTAGLLCPTRKCSTQ